MRKQELVAKLTQTAKSLLSYCAARTSNHFDAEDLAQDIMLEVYKSAGRIRDPEAIYGFLWGVAGNVYKQWCKRRAKERWCALTDQLPEMPDAPGEEDSVLYLLRRELALLSEKYRKAVILYYMEGRSCTEIAAR